MTQEPTESAAPLHDGPQTEPPNTEPSRPDQEESVRDSFTRLYADGRAYAQAEIDKQKLRAAIVGAGARDVLILGLTAAVLIFASLIAGLVGLIITLSPLIGAGWATLAIFGSGVVLALLLLLIAKSRIGHTKRAIRP